MSGTRNCINSFMSAKKSTKLSQRRAETGDRVMIIKMNYLLNSLGCVCFSAQKFLLYHKKKQWKITASQRSPVTLKTPIIRLNKPWNHNPWNYTIIRLNNKGKKEHNMNDQSTNESMYISGLNDCDLNGILKCKYMIINEHKRKWMVLFISLFDC